MLKSLGIGESFVTPKVTLLTHTATQGAGFWVLCVGEEAKFKTSFTEKQTLTGFVRPTALRSGEHV